MDFVLLWLERISSSEILFLGHFGWELAHKKSTLHEIGWWKRSSSHHSLSLHGQMQWQMQRSRVFQLHSTSSSSQLWPCWPAVAQAHHQVFDCRLRKAILLWGLLHQLPLCSHSLAAACSWLLRLMDGWHLWNSSCPFRPSFPSSSHGCTMSNS